MSEGAKQLLTIFFLGIGAFLVVAFIFARLMRNTNYRAERDIKNPKKAAEAYRHVERAIAFLESSARGNHYAKEWAEAEIKLSEKAWQEAFQDPPAEKEKS
jgi:hypothetical protein